MCGGVGSPVPPVAASRRAEFLAARPAAVTTSRSGATRAGDQLTITTAARARDTSVQHHVAWHRRTVAAQRWTSRGWATFTTLTPDDHGNASTTLRVPCTVGLRAIDANPGQIWAATSASVVLGEGS